MSLCRLLWPNANVRGTNEYLYYYGGLTGYHALYAGRLYPEGPKPSSLCQRGQFCAITIAQDTSEPGALLFGSCRASWSWQTGAVDQLVTYVREMNGAQGRPGFTALGVVVWGACVNF